MKVAVIVDGWFPAVGGGQINAWEVSSRIAKHGVRIDIITRNQGEYNLPKVKNLRIIQLGEKKKVDNLLDQLLFSVRLVPFLLNRRYDIIHSHPFIPAFSSKIVNILQKTPIIFTVHGTRLFASKKKWSLSLVVEYIIVKLLRYNAIISVTSTFQKIANSKQRIVVIPNSVNKKDFLKIRVSRQKEKILWVGRFDRVKRVDILLEAYRIVKKTLPKSTLTLVGYGYQERKLKSLVEKMELKDVTFKGILSGNDLVREYKSSSVFVLSSESEGQPITILEALAAGIPVVAPNLGGIPELLNKDCGVLTKPGSATNLSKGIIYALSNRERLLKNINNKLKKSMSWEDAAKKTFNLYEIVNGSSN